MVKAKTKAKAKPAAKAKAKPAVKTEPLARAKAAKIVAPKPPAGKALIVPLKAISIAKENPRYGRPVEDLDEIAASVRAHGQIQELVCYQVGAKGFYACTDGARRLAGMAQAELPDAKIMVYGKEDAIELGLAAQVERVNLHPADEAVAFAKMMKAGDTAAAIANAFGRSERFVLQRQKLAGLHPPILSALRADEIDLSIAGAFANAPPARQSSLWKRHGKNASSGSIERDLKKDKVSDAEPIVRFVGIAAYEAAGGKVDRDLFAFVDPFDLDDARPEEVAAALDKGATWIEDMALLEKLAGEKIDAKRGELLEAGWGFVEWMPDGRFGNNYGKYQEAPKKATSKADRTKQGVILSLNRDGQLKVEAGLVTTATAAKAKKASAQKAKGKTAAAGDAEPRAEMSNLAHYTLTRQAGVMVGRSLSAKPAIAIAVLAAHLAGQHFGYELDTSAHALMDLHGRGRYAPAGLKSDEGREAVEAEWFKELKAIKGPLAPAIAAWPMDDQLRLLAYLTGELFDWKEDKPLHADDGEREELAAIGKLAGVDPVKHFTVDRDFAGGLSKEALAAACRDMSIEAPDKKGLMADAVVTAAADKGWVPPLLLQLTGVAGAPAKAKPAKAAKRGRK